MAGGSKVKSKTAYLCIPAPFAQESPAAYYIKIDALNSSLRFLTDMNDIYRELIHRFVPLLLTLITVSVGDAQTPA